MSAIGKIILGLALLSSLGWGQAKRCQDVAGNDQYCCPTAANVAGQNTGYFHIANINGSPLVFSPLGNACFSSHIDNVRLQNTEGYDPTGQGYQTIARARHAIGLGPSDGTSGQWTTGACDLNAGDQRTGYYGRADLINWRFMGTGTFGYDPMTLDHSWCTLGHGTNPANPLPWIFGTINFMPDAMRNGSTVSGVTQPAKDLFASFRAAHSGFPAMGESGIDGTDPHWGASISADAAAHIVGHLSDSFLHSVWMGEQDEDHDKSLYHKNIAGLVMASNPVISSDPHWSATFTDTTNYAKVELQSEMQAKYTTIAALNVAWGTSYLGWGSCGGWSASWRCFMDEDGTHVPHWNSTGCPSRGYASGNNGCLTTDAIVLPGNTAAQKIDLQNFTTVVVRKQYGTFANTLRAIPGWHYMILGPYMYGSPYPAVWDGMVDGSGNPIFDLYITGTSGIVQAQLAYQKTKTPVLYAYNLAPADPDSSLAFAGIISAPPTAVDGQCGTQGVQIVSATSNFWWWAGPWEYNANTVLLEFSNLGVDMSGGNAYQFYVRAWIDAHTMIVCPYNSGGSGSRADLLAHLVIGGTFRRQDGQRVTQWGPNPVDYTILTQADRAAWIATKSITPGIFSATTETYGVLSAVNQVDPISGKHYVIPGFVLWDWADPTPKHAADRSPNNQGIITLNGNPYDGSQAGSAASPSTDGWGFPRTPDVSTLTTPQTWGDFITPITALNVAGQAWVIAQVGGGGPTLSITSGPCGNATIGVFYECDMTATGGTTPYTWSFSAGNLTACTGLSLATVANVGVISGTPTVAATCPFTERVTDNVAATADQPNSVTVNAPTSGITSIKGVVTIKGSVVVK